MVIPEQRSIQLDDLNRQEGEQPSSRLFSTMAVRHISEKRAIEYIPTVFDSSTPERHQRRETSTLTIHPWWLPSRGFELGLHISASGNILPSLRPYIIQPPDSEIFYAVSGGDLNVMLRLFSSGQSSPFVRDSTGCSLLHVGYTIH